MVVLCDVRYWRHAITNLRMLSTERSGERLFQVGLFLDNERLRA
jgi:hypothetical protein